MLKGNAVWTVQSTAVYTDPHDRDYADNERLDNYEQEGVDDTHYEPLDIGARNALDNNLNRRDVEIRRREGRVAGAFIYGLDDDANDTQPAVRRHRHIYEAQELDQDEDGVVSVMLTGLASLKLTISPSVA